MTAEEVKALQAGETVTVRRDMKIGPRERVQGRAGVFLPVQLRHPSPQFHKKGGFEMTITFKNATEDEKEAVKRTLRELEEQHTKEADLLGLAAQKLVACKEDKQILQALEIIRGVRKQHSNIAYTVSHATIVFE